TLRLYQWAPPTISLGYFQHYADYGLLLPPAGELPVVRRLTGGGAILHDLELTYSLSLPVGHPLLADGPGRLYELAHDAVIKTLMSLGLRTQRCGTSDDSGAAKGPFFCFQRRHCYDVLLGSDKIAGSAQRRTRNAVLQHGSIVLANRFAQQPTAVVERPFDKSIRGVRSAMVAAFARISGFICGSGNWSSEELTAAEALNEKYASAPWTQRT
ncbi:MAG: biotin/lipoate A/B protein ligase family protein, partial [Planctomycetota bacterium]